jgi:hypothetical protein
MFTSRLTLSASLNAASAVTIAAKRSTCRRFNQDDQLDTAPVTACIYSERGNVAHPRYNGWDTASKHRHELLSAPAAPLHVNQNNETAGTPC